jgi:hypothetical protein
VKMKLNGTQQLLAYADDVNLLGDNTDTIEENTETLTDASKEVGLEINALLEMFFINGTMQVCQSMPVSHTVLQRDRGKGTRFAVQGTKRFVTPLLEHP